MRKIKREIIPNLIYAFSLIILIALNAFIKIYHFGDGRLYYSDAALRFHYAEMFSQGKKIPIVDKQVLYPEGLKVRTLIHLTMDWVIGNSHRLFFAKLPFTDYVKYFVCIFSSFSVLLVFLLGALIWQKKGSGLIAGVFYAIGIPSFWRIAGNYLRESFALPFIFTALYLFSYSLISPSATRQKLMLFFSGVGFTLSLITWHLSQFFFTVFVGFLICLFILNDNAVKIFKNLWLFFIPILLAGLTWQPISSKYFILSFPLVMSIWLWLIAILGFKQNTYLKRIFLAFGFIPIYFILIRIFPRYFAEYGHVFETIIAKIVNLGHKPANPATLSFDARSIWMGPFASPGPLTIVFSILVPFLLAIIGWLGSLNRNFFKQFDYNRLLISYFIIVFTILYFLVIRLEVFLFFFLAVAIGANLNLIREKKKLRQLLLISLIAGFLIESYKTYNFKQLFQTYYLKLAKEWLTKPTAYGSDWERLSNWIKENTKPDQAILADVDISAMLLTYLDRPIIIQPIYENTIARQRAQECLNAFYQTETDFLKLFTRYQIKYVIYQQDLLLDYSKESNRYLTNNMKVKKNSVAYAMHFQPENLKRFALRYQTNTFRVYQVLEKDEPKPITPRFPYSPYFDSTFFPQNPRDEFFDDSYTVKVESLIYQVLNQYNLASQLMQKNNYQNAIAHLESILKIFPDFERTYYYLGLSYQRLSYYEPALSYFDQAIKALPQDLDSYIAKASILAKQNRILEATTTLIAAIKINPKQSNLFANLGYLYITSNQIDQGLNTFKKLAESLPASSPLHLYTGFLYGYKNDLANAEKEFKQALAIDSTNPEVYEALGSLYLQSKELAKAITYFEKSLKLNPNQPKIITLLAELRKSRD